LPRWLETRLKYTHEKVISGSKKKYSIYINNKPIKYLEINLTRQELYEENIEII